MNAHASFSWWKNTVARQWAWVLLFPLIWAAPTADLFAGSNAPRPPDPAPSAPLAVHIQIDDMPITPVTANFIRRAIREAEQQGASCLVIELNTPGGLVNSTQQIVTDILASETPVVVYVSPAGGRAASAGLFITLASDVAAMAPGTRIGAAHPVHIGPSPVSPPTPTSGEEQQTPLADKLVNDTTAWARSLAELRGRNPEWSVLAVQESRSITSAEALDNEVVELLANSIGDLLQQLDGREVIRGGAVVTLETDGAEIKTLQTWWGERLLSVIANPNIALVLLLLGVYGVLYELYSPGWGVGGTVGVISLVLAFFAMSVLPINYAGLALILLALGMFVAEAFVVSYGALAGAGIMCLVVGGTMLVDSPAGFMQVSLKLLVPIAAATALITVFLVASVVRAHASRIQTGIDSLLGASATVRGEFVREADGITYSGPVFVHGELWIARTKQPVRAGQPVRVTSRDGLTLVVEAEDTADRGKQQLSATT